MIIVYDIIAKCAVLRKLGNCIFDFGDLDNPVRKETQVTHA